MSPNPISYDDFFAASASPKPDVINPLTQRFKYDFPIAFADPGTFPSADLHKALGRALEEEGGDLAYYPHHQGHPAMRELLAQDMREFFRPLRG
ncbi:MAG: hypothetical protein V3U79_12080 [Dehalococcoidia bacterium]